MRARSASGERPIDCSICLMPLEAPSAEEGRSSSYQLGCLHSFHPECIQRWLAVNPTCPICRTGVVQGTGLNRADRVIIDSQPLANARASIIDVTSNESARRVNSVASRVFGWP